MKSLHGKKNALTEAGIVRSLFLFAGPMVIGNFLQQLYNLTDTFVVGRYLGANALAAVGGTYALTTFLYSVMIGFCMGCGALVAFCSGKKDEVMLKRYMHLSFFITGGLSIMIEVGMLLLSRQVLRLLQIPMEILTDTNAYLRIILAGILFVFLFHYYTYVLRAVGDSATPLYFLCLSTVINIGLDILFVAVWKMGVQGAALATLIAQMVSCIGLVGFCLCRYPQLRPHRREMVFSRQDVFNVLRQSGMSSMQQSVMNFGILMVQGLVNSFGTTVMAAFTVAVKIDTMAYMPAQEFANAYSLFISQNYGAGRMDRVEKGTRSAMKVSTGFCLSVSVIVFLLAGQLMELFVGKAQEVVTIGAEYLRIEGAFYVGIGLLFLLYGYFRGMHRPEISLVLTIISLGTRVLLAYSLSAVPLIGTTGIWLAIPIGWFLADVAGVWFMKH